jgi:hypothetical protein
LESIPGLLKSLKIRAQDSTVSDLFWLSWEALFSAVVNRQLLISSSLCTLSEVGSKRSSKEVMKKEVMKLQ